MLVPALHLYSLRFLRHKDVLQRCTIGAGDHLKCYGTSCGNQRLRYYLKFNGNLCSCQCLVHLVWDRRHRGAFPPTRVADQGKHPATVVATAESGAAGSENTQV